MNTQRQHESVDGHCQGENCPEMLRVKGKLGSINVLQRYILGFFIGTFAFQYATLTKLDSFINQHMVEEANNARGTDETRRIAVEALHKIDTYLGKDADAQCQASLNTISNRVSKLEYAHEFKEKP